MSLTVRIIVIVSAALHLSSARAQTASVYRPASLAGVRTCVPGLTLDGSTNTVTDFVVANMGIYWLIRQRGEAHDLLVHTDAQGKCFGTSTLPVHYGQAFGVGPTGAVFVASVARNSDKTTTTQLMQLRNTDSGNASASNVQTLVGVSPGPMIVTSGPLFVDTAHTTLINPASGLSIPVPLRWPRLLHRIVLFNDTTAAILEIARNRVHLVNLNSSNVQSVDLSAPEIDQALAKIPAAKYWPTTPTLPPHNYSTALWGMTVVNGKLVVGVSRFKLTEGAVFVEFLPSGVRSGAFRCAMPEISLAGDLFVPSGMCSFNNQLFLLDGRGWVVSYAVGVTPAAVAGTKYKNGQTVKSLH